MKDYGFEVAHGYRILRGYINDCKSKEDATTKILNEEWDDILDTFSKDECTIGYEIVDIWECR